MRLCRIHRRKVLELTGVIEGVQNWIIFIEIVKGLPLY